jgi:hypothetical protein
MALLHPSGSVTAQTWTTARRPPRLAIARNLLRAGVEWSGRRPRAVLTPRPRRAHPRVVREPAGPAEGETPLERPLC